MSTIDAWLDIIRREAHAVAYHGEATSTLIATGYNPKTHAVKGMLVPHMVETGWVPLTAVHAGNGFGILVGPKVGDAQKLDGDQFDVGFEFGDANTPVARHRMFSTPDAPPEVQSGEMLVQHESGNKLFFAADKSMTWMHHSGGFHTWDKDGKLTIKTADQDVTIDAGKGKHTLTAKSFAIAGNLEIKGDINQTGNLTTSGTVNAQTITQGTA